MKSFQVKRPIENVYLITSIVVTVLLLYFFYDLNAFLTIGITIFGLLYIRLLQGQYLGNALQVSSKHFFRIKQIAEYQARKLRMPEPKIFISQDPNPNAYTLGFKHPYTIVLNSSLVEKLDEEEVESVLAHEMGHAKLHHPRIGSLVSPAGNTIFFFSWIFGFWQREAETSADNISLVTTQNPRGLITAITKISIGPTLLDNIDEEELLGQSKEIKRNKLNGIGEWLNTHPYLITRINNILNNAKKLGVNYVNGGIIYCTSCGRKMSVSARYCYKCGKEITSLFAGRQTN